VSIKDKPTKAFQIVPSNRYEKDIRKLKKSGVSLSKLETVIDLLAQGRKLDEKYRDHELKGLLKGTRECHITPDWLLTYKKDHDKLLLLLIRTGSHRDVLGIE
jgi:mRNA interferase YafQ